MKLLHGNGKELTVYDLGPAVYRLRAGRVPIKLHGWMILEDDEAREKVRELLAADLDHRPDSARDSPASEYPEDQDVGASAVLGTKP